MKTILATILFALVSVSSVVAQKIEPPKLTPTPLTDSQRSLIREGIALHDRGDYDGAIAKYEEVLRETPENDFALYELALTYQAKKDYRKSLELAYKGAQYISDNLTGFYVLIGNNLDELGEPKKAIEVYERGIKIRPNTKLLHYNLAITYSRLNKPEETRNNLKKELFVNPNHPSSHLALGQLFYRGKYKTPALFAVMRFLVVEPKSRRSVTAYQIFSELMGAGVTQGKTANEINIFVDTGGKKDEGDFEALEFTLALTKAADADEKSKNKSAVERLVDQLNTQLTIVSEMESKGDKSKFTWRYYIPYFVELRKRNYVEPFTYYISQSSDLNGVTEWLQANANRVDEFLSWSKSYQWAKE